ncbi:MAG: bifunctional serine/threonine-protein kinase/formylglycine-generating enzyme family protein [Chthoniobacter sp.]|uniref:bifunctional serine/threonine-protein kinase/formylglycine-generating enzyme family protein n=1 Tax=Chthoniobacter sp. TaxID=2510640 RepID=UPI0032A4639C
MSLEGKQIGEFEILERLGQGGMGAVYKARQTTLDRFVALKTLQISLAEDAEYVARFRQEAKAAAGLIHPNLVQVFSAGENGGLHWFAMEYVEGESAKIRLNRKGRLDPLEAIAIAIHVATALEYGWRKAALIHRDIKPDNIFLSSDGEVKLGDLGLAKCAGKTQELTMTGASMGTPHYISPEQVEAMKDVDLRADIYSLGCTLYHLLSGQAPFEGNSAVAIMLKHVHGPVPNLRSAWPECPQVLSDGVGKMMQKHPSNRQQNHGQVIADLRRAYDAMGGERGPDTEAATQKPTLVEKKRGLPMAAWMGGVGALVAAIAAPIYFGPWKKGEVAVGTTNPAISQAAAREGGMKVAVTGTPVVTAATPATATKDQPFVNYFGMKFVPVPIIGGPTGGHQVLFSVWDTRVQDYAEFVRETKREWPKVDFEQGPMHPAVMVSWEDAQLFCQWLNQREQVAGRLPTGCNYRLPTDHEWSCAVEIGAREDPAKLPSEKNGKINQAFPSDTQSRPPEKAGIFARMERNPLEAGIKTRVIPSNSGYTTSPVGSYVANRFGLYDMGGNVWQWCQEWFDEDHKDRVLRGASLVNLDRHSLLASCRSHDEPTLRYYDHGFRCVLDLPAN